MFLDRNENENKKENTRIISKKIVGPGSKELEVDYYEYKGIIIGVQSKLESQRLDKADVSRIVDTLKNEFPNYYKLIDSINLTDIVRMAGDSKARVMINGCYDGNYFILENTDLSREAAFNAVQKGIKSLFASNLAAEFVGFRDDNVEPYRRREFRERYIDAMKYDCAIDEDSKPNIHLIQEDAEVSARVLMNEDTTKRLGRQTRVALVEEELNKEMMASSRSERSNYKDQLVAEPTKESSIDKAKLFIHKALKYFTEPVPKDTLQVSEQQKKTSSVNSNPGQEPGWRKAERVILRTSYPTRQGVIFWEQYGFYPWERPVLYEDFLRSRGEYDLIR